MTRRTRRNHSCTLHSRGCRGSRAARFPCWPCKRLRHWQRLHSFTFSTYELSLGCSARTTRSISNHDYQPSPRCLASDSFL